MTDQKDIDKYLELALTDGEVKWEPEENVRIDIPNFVKYLNLTTGKTRIAQYMLRILYEDWSDSPLTEMKFHKLLKNYVKKEQAYYFIDTDALNISIEDIKKKLGPILLKRANDNIKKEKERSIEEIRSSQNEA
jgi:hypothetical protein